MSQHRVQHIPITASSEDGRSPAPSKSFISQRMLLYSTPYIPTITSKPKNTVSVAIAPPHQSTASKYCSILAGSSPRSESLSTLDFGLNVYVQTRSIMASQCISTRDRSLPQSKSLSSLDLSLQVHLQTCSITSPDGISEFSGSRSPCACPNLLDHYLPVHVHTSLIMAAKCILRLLHLCLQVHVQSRLTRASWFISVSTQCQSPIASPNSLDHGLKV
jgi:hypothetical protein